MPGSLQPSVLCRVDPVSPVWKANQPITMVDRNPEAMA